MTSKQLAFAALTCSMLMTTAASARRVEVPTGFDFRLEALQAQAALGIVSDPFSFAVKLDVEALTLRWRHFFLTPIEGQLGLYSNANGLDFFMLVGGRIGYPWHFEDPSTHLRAGVGAGYCFLHSASSSAPGLAVLYPFLRMQGTLKDSILVGLELSSIIPVQPDYLGNRPVFIFLGVLFGFWIF